MAAVYKALSTNGKSSKKTSNSTAPENGTQADDHPRNRQKVLLLSSRGTTMRHRHLINDLHSLMPHSRKESKLDTKTKLYQLNELADLYNCNNVLFFEARKARDLYCWMSKAPNGPTVKMHLQNLHTMEELHFRGNCLKGSRPIVSFDKTFENEPHLQVIRELLLHTFGVPKSSRKIKPFVDHVMSFTVADGRVWCRTWQIEEKEAERVVNGEDDAGEKKKKKVVKDGAKEMEIELVEIGPRFVLTPIVILESSFGGPVIYENKEFVSPNQVRADLKISRAGKRNHRADQGSAVDFKRGELGLKTDGGKKKKRDELDTKVLFG